MRETHPDTDDPRHSFGEQRRMVMSVAKVIEITSASSESFEDAIRQGIAKAGETVRDNKGAWVSHRLEGQLRARVSAEAVGFRRSR